MDKKGMSTWLKVLLIIIGIIVLLFVGMVVYYMINPSAEFYPSNEVPMYGYKDYQDYLANRPAEIAEIDDKFVNSILNTSGTRENGSYWAVERGWDYIFAGDTSTAMKRFNQAWLLDSNNYRVYWGFAVTLGKEAQEQNSEELMASSVEMFDKAIELYDEKNNANIWDKLSLYCDAVYSNILKAETGDSPEVIKAFDLLGQVKAMKFETTNETFIDEEKARCSYYEAQIWFEKKDYAKSWESIKIARELDPNSKWYKSDSPFVVALTNQMPEQQ